MFEGWEDYYLLIGSAGAALIGLMFVVVTLNRASDVRQAERAASVYLTPTLFHFAIVLMASGLALAPRLSPNIVSIGLGVLAVAGLAHAGSVVIRIGRHKIQAPHWSDLWCYGVLPVVAYAALGASAAVVAQAERAGALSLAGSLMGLLLIAIRNAWDLVTWLAPRAATEADPATSGDGKVTSS